ncbi:MAG: helix-turn-helix domain-containing protein, partial [Bacteroidota bacterium]
TYEKIFQDIEREFRHPSRDSKAIIAHYLHILLLKISGRFRQLSTDTAQKNTQRAKDIAIVNRFKSLLELSFRADRTYTTSSPHQVQYYADMVHLHPSHFNAVIKRITDIPASEHIQQHVLGLAKLKLAQTTDSVKEIAFALHYPYPNHFTNFFKKRTKLTPTQFRKSMVR